MRKLILTAAAITLLSGCASQEPSAILQPPEVTIGDILAEPSRYVVLERNFNEYWFKSGTSHHFNKQSLEKKEVRHNDTYHTGWLTYKDIKSKDCFYVESRLIKLEKHKYYDSPFLEVHRAFTSCELN